jgi:hypothetical protein
MCYETRSSLTLNIVVMDIMQGCERDDRIDAALSKDGSVRKAVKWA